MNIEPAGAQVVLPRYRVDNWQIPVPIGDASAHFLVEVVEPKPRVINSFFMDGGDNAQHHGGDDTACKKIAQALTTIDDAYEGTAWKFDAIVTTHHDRDHYYGLAELLVKVVTRPDHPLNITYRAAYFANDLTYYRGNNDDGFSGWQPRPHTHVISGENAIGIDIFSRTRMFQRHGNVNLAGYDMSNGVNAYVNNQAQLRKPRFAVVGANGYGVHPQSQQQITTTPTENQKSLLAVLYWPENGRTSYFTGGDGNPKVELGGVVPWMGANAHHSPTLPVDMVKLDHHGSLNETLNMVEDCHNTILTRMEPKHVLVTPGNKHGHPNWVIMKLVKKYFDESARGTLLYTTRSPYWLSKKRTNMLDTNTNHAGQNKVVPIFGSDGKYGNNSAFTHDTLLIGEMDSWGDDNVEYKRLYEEFVEELRRRSDWKWYFDKNKKPNRRAINKFLKGMDKELLAQQKMSTKLTAKTRIEEPDLTPLQIVKQMGQDNRENISWSSRQTWNEISNQEICDHGSPYFLVRFWFECDTDPVVDCSMDETGKTKPTQADLSSNLSKRPLKTFESEHIVDDRGHDTVITTITNPKSTAKHRFEHAEGLGTFEQRMNYISFELADLDLKIAEAFTGVKIIAQQDKQPFDWIQQMLQNPIASPSPTNSILPTQLSGIETMTLNSMSGPGGHNIQKADFTDYMVNDATKPGSMMQFSGEWDELISFTAFVEQYCVYSEELLPYAIKKGIKPRGPGRKKANYEEAIRMLRVMEEQWIDLRNFAETAATAQYATAFSTHHRKLKMQRLNEAQGPDEIEKPKNYVYKTGPR